MNVVVQGIGWLTKEGYGCVKSGHRQTFDPEQDMHTFVKEDIFSYSFKNFGRLDPVSKMTAYGVALALRDAGIGYSPERKQDMGIIATSAEGCLQADLAYFRDYVQEGRTLSRGNLFLYTLPSSPAGEAAIHFGLRGPLLYVAGGENSLLQALDTASQMVRECETPAMVAGKADGEEAIFFVIGADSEQSTPALCRISEAGPAVRASGQVSELVQKFLKVRKV